MKFKSLGAGIFTICTLGFVFLYIYTALAVDIYIFNCEISFSQWKIGQGYYFSDTFITDTETSCNITARVRYDPDDFPFSIIDGPDWNVTMTHGFIFDRADDTNIYDEIGLGNAHVPSSCSNNGRGNTPMSVTMSVTITWGSHPDSEGAESKTIVKTITQDTIDQIRQEYVDHGIPVPSRSAFTKNSSYNTGDYSYAVDRDLAGRKVNWAVALDVDALDELRLSSGYRNPEHNRHHIGTPKKRGALKSRHQYGDALDIYTFDVNNDGVIDVTDSDEMIDGAEEAGASKTWGYPPGYVHVHADWR